MQKYYAVCIEKGRVGTDLKFGPTIEIEEVNVHSKEVT